MKGSKPILWLKGPAGSGKSAISQTVAEHYAAENRLGGSFFFLRGAGDRSRISHLIPTLAYQLSISLPAAEQTILSCMKKEPNLLRSSLEYQFFKLIAEPILAVTNPILHFVWPKPIIFIIDALDECDDKMGMAEFIDALIRAFPKPSYSPFRVFVTSRIEEHIKEKLKAWEARAAIHHLSLEDFDARVDIRAFLQSRLTAIYEAKREVMRDVSLPWPSNQDLDKLVEKAGGVFIFAVTLMRFMEAEIGLHTKIIHPDEMSPPREVIVLEQSTSSSEMVLPQASLQNALQAELGLDSLYTKILSTVPPTEKFKRIVGTIMLLARPLSIIFLGELLQLQANEIVQSLLGVQSIFFDPRI